MPDYKKAFEILIHSFKPQLKNKHSMVQDNTKYEYYLSKEEYKIIEECLNAEPDSMDKIIEEFKRIKWKTDTPMKDIEGGYVVFKRNDGEEEEKLTITPFGYEYGGSKFIRLGYSQLTTFEIALINRVLKLWGIEV